MVDFIGFLLIILSGLFFSGVFKKFNIPYVTALILAGIAIGPFGLKLFTTDPTIELIGAIGAVFLMFMAGLEVHINNVKDISRSTWCLTALNSVIPFITGFLIGNFFGYSFITSVTIGVVFISSSIAVIVPQLEKYGLLNRKIGRTILTSAVFEDIGSLLLLSIVLQAVVARTALPLPAYFFIILLSIILMKMVYPYMKRTYSSIFAGKDTYEGEVRFLFVVLIGTAIYFELLGMHAIVAGFIVGMVLAESIKNKDVKLKLRTISYGLFIPTFFVIIGAKTDLSFITSTEIMWFIAIFVLALVVSKIVSGYIAAKLSGFTPGESLFVGVATTPQLSTTLAAAFAALELGLLDSTIITSLIALSVFTTLLSPIAIRHLTTRITS